MDERGLLRRKLKRPQERVTSMKDLDHECLIHRVQDVGRRNDAAVVLGDHLRGLALHLDESSFERQTTDVEAVLDLEIGGDEGIARLDHRLVVLVELVVHECHHEVETLDHGGRGRELARVDVTHQVRQDRHGDVAHLRRAAHGVTTAHVEHGRKVRASHSQQCLEDANLLGFCLLARCEIVVVTSRHRVRRQGRESRWR